MIIFGVKQFGNFLVLEASRKRGHCHTISHIYGSIMLVI